MILSNLAIHDALDSGQLIIRPEPQPRFMDTTGKCPYQTSSVDLRLGTEISYFKEGFPAAVDLRQGSFACLFAANSETRILTDDQPFALKPGKLVLGKTMEYVEFVLNDSNILAGRIEGKSSYARCGLLVHFTAPTIHAGFGGTITLELINHGPLDIMLYPGAPICQLIIEEVRGRPFRNDSQFQGQSAAAGVIRK